MEFTGVYHKTSEQMSYPYNENQLIVNIKTGYDVKMCIRDRERADAESFPGGRKRTPL